MKDTPVDYAIYNGIDVETRLTINTQGDEGTTRCQNRIFDEKKCIYVTSVSLF